MDSAADNFNADATSDDGSCEYTVDVDEVPGFGLLAAVAAIGVALILRRRL
jgi:PGF-CTERM protein